MVEIYEIIPNSEIDNFTSMFLTPELKDRFMNKYSSMINFDMCIRDMVWELCATPLIPTYVQKEIEDLLLTKAIKEKYINNTDLKFIPRIKDQTIETDKKVYIKVEEFTHFLWNKVKIQIHFEMISYQRHLCQEIYQKMSNELDYFFLHPNIIGAYELNKLSLVASLAYTLQNLHKMSWHASSFQFINDHKKEIKYYPQIVNGIKQEMSNSWLYMSLLNEMVYKCNHKYNGQINVVSLRNLAKFSKKTLANYTEEEKIIILKIVKDIKKQTMSECSWFCLGLLDSLCM